MDQLRAPFVVFEGVDGSGKSTAASYFRDALIAKGIHVTITGEPTKFKIGQLIRKSILSEHDPKQMLFLFMADRCFHNTKIIESLDSGCVVICDRYSLSSRVYQHGAVNEGMLEFFCTNNEFNIKADLLIHFTAKIDTLVERVSKRGTKDIFETRSSIEINKNKYSSIIRSNVLRYAKNYELVESDCSIEELYSQLDKIIEEYWLMFSEYVVRK